MANFEKNNYTFALAGTGLHERRWIKIHDHSWGRDLRDYVRSEAAVKGRPNMTVGKFTEYVNSVVLPAAIKAGDGMGFPRKLSAMGFLAALLVCGCTIWDVFSKMARKMFIMMAMKEKMWLTTGKID